MFPLVWADFHPVCTHADGELINECNMLLLAPSSHQVNVVGKAMVIELPPSDGHRGVMVHPWHTPTIIGKSLPACLFKNTELLEPSYSALMFCTKPSYMLNTFHVHDTFYCPLCHTLLHSTLLLHTKPSYMLNIHNTFQSPSCHAQSKAFLIYIY